MTGIIDRSYIHLPNLGISQANGLANESISLTLINYGSVRVPVKNFLETSIQLYEISHRSDVDPLAQKMSPLSVVG